MSGYRPMTLADLAGRLARTSDPKIRWKLVWEFLDKYRWETADVQLALLQDVVPHPGSRLRRPGAGLDANRAARQEDLLYRDPGRVGEQDRQGI